MVPAKVTNVFPSGVKEVFRVTPCLRAGGRGHREPPVPHRRRLVRARRSRRRRPGGDAAPCPGSGRGRVDARRASRAAGAPPRRRVVRKRQPLRYASTDEANLEAVGAAARRRSGSPRSATTTRRRGARRCASRRRTSSTHGRRNPIAEWLDELGLFGLRSHEKFVPTPGLPCRTSRWRCSCGTCGQRTGACGGTSATSSAAFTTRRRVVVWSTTSHDSCSASACSVGSRRSARPGTATVGTYRSAEPRTSVRFIQLIGVHGARGEAARALGDRLRDVAANTNIDTVPREVWDAGASNCSPSST